MIRLLEFLKENKTNDLLIKILKEYEEIAEYEFFIRKQDYDILLIDNILRVDLQSDDESIYYYISNIGELYEDILNYYDNCDNYYSDCNEIDTLARKYEKRFIKSFVKLVNADSEEI